jgi:flagellar basal-body rod protein FlgB
MDLLNNALGIHERALQTRSQRLELLAQNIANADTPQYKARDLDFKKVMSGEMSQPVTTAWCTAHRSTPRLTATQSR